MSGTSLERESTGARLAVEFRTISMVWRRELIRFVRSGPRVVTGFVQPILFLFVLGAGLSPLIGSSSGFDFKKFVFPGVVAMSVITTALFSAISIVWDREFGFLREMLVAPVSRSSLVLGKAFGGATVATIQGAVMMVLAPIIGVRLTPVVVVEVLAIAFLMAFALNAFGVFVASRVTRMENFQVVMQFLMFPMLFLSGALFPVNGLPGWLTPLTRIDPLTYAIDPLRRVVFAAQDVPAAALARFGTGVELLGYHLAIVTELLIVIAFALVFLVVAIRSFGRPE